MADSASTNMGLRIQESGQNNDSWGDITNTNLQLVEDAISEIVSVAHNNSNQGITLTDTDFTADQSRAALIRITGSTIDADRVVNLPNKKRFYLLSNQITTDFGIEFKAGNGTSVTVPRGRTTPCYCDGSGNIVNQFDWIHSLKVDNLTFDTAIPKTNLPTDIVYDVPNRNIAYVLQGTNESLSSGFGDVNNINPWRVTNNHQIDGAVVQTSQVIKFPLSDIYGRNSKLLRVGETNAIIYDIRMFIVENSGSRRVEPGENFWQIDLNNYIRRGLRWYKEGNDLVIPSVEGGISNRLRANGTLGPTHNANNYDVVVHIFAGRY